MGVDCVAAINGKKPFDLVIEHVKIVNVFTQQLLEGSVAICGDTIAYVGEMDFPYTAGKVIDGKGRYAVPGLIDAHMHFESSMMAPAHFIETVLSFGTTTVAADPHEIGNVFGLEGIRALTDHALGTPLHVLMMAPSTIPSAPGLERSGFSMEAPQMAEALEIPGVKGLGEVMDFNGVADGDERILAVVETARKKGVMMDCHVPALTGKRLQAFRSTGLDCDHTDMSLPRLKEKLAAGFSVQVQRNFFSAETMEYLNHFPLQDRIMLITDDIPFINLVKEGHLNANLRRAVALGLDPIRAVRYATINAATRLRLYDRGAVSPGYKADVLLMEDLKDFVPSLVLSDGQVVAREGKCLISVPSKPFPEAFYHSVHVLPLEASDFSLPDLEGTKALCNVLGGNTKVTRTTKTQQWIPIRNGRLDTEGLIKLAVIYRHGYGPEKAPGKEVSLALLSGFPHFRGALATTYAHDSHNLMAFGQNDGDMALAANRLIEMGGGLCAVLEGRVISAVSLPVAGLLTEEPVEALTGTFESFFQAVKNLRLEHENPMMFLTLMSLAVSPEIKCTDLGLVDVLEKKFIPLIVSTQ